MIGYIKGYEICNVTKKKIEKESLILNDIQKTDDNIKEQILYVLENKGYVYGLKEKNVLKAVYLFDKIKENEKNILRYNKCIYTKEVEKQKEKFEKAIIEELKEKVTFENFSKVEWNDIEIEPKEIDGISVKGLPIGLVLGIVYGIIFDNIILGILFGLTFGLIFGVSMKKKL